MRISLPRLTILMLAMSLVGACAVLPFRIDEKATAPILTGFGSTTLEPSQANVAARSLFAQGMAQVYAFNGPEAIRAFKAALAKDPACALCAWGVAYQMGPNINNTSRGDLREAVKYVEYARLNAANATPRERSLIDSLALRYGHASAVRNDPALMGALCATPSDVAKADPLDFAYAAHMRALADQYPDDPDLAAFYAEAEMIATPGAKWDIKTGKPAGRIGAMADRIEAITAKHPEHIGLNHYLIHAVDVVAQAKRAEAAADRLGALAPKSPHLLHMPSHIYAHVGRYADATRVNQQAVAADQSMMALLKTQGFSVTLDWRSHNRHFQWYSALMEGRSELALETARTAAAAAPGDYEYHEYVRSLPMLTLLHVQRWDAILKEPLPTGEKGVATVLGQMVRGIALARSGQLEAAKAALAKVEPAAAKLVKAHATQGWMDRMVKSLAGTAGAQLRAELAMAEQRPADALAEQAKAAEAALAADSTEPPMLADGPRQRLGAMQLQAGKLEAAEETFRKDLAAHPANGWSLKGLHATLQAQGKQSEAQARQREFELSWAKADTELRQR